MLIELNTLRFAIYVDLLLEIDAAKFAKRAKNKALIRIKKNYFDSIVLVDPSDMVTVSRGQHELTIPKPLGMVTVQEATINKRSVYVLHLLYADSSIDTTILLFAALSLWKTLIPDAKVSPAARKVIQSYYSKESNNPELVTKEFIKSSDKRTQQTLSKINRGDKDVDRFEIDYLNAAYHDPGNFPLEQFLSQGEKILNSLQTNEEQTKRAIYLAAQYGFNAAYKDKERTQKEDEFEVDLSDLNKSAEELKKNKTGILDKIKSFLKKNDGKITKNDLDSMIAAT